MRFGHFSKDIAIDLGTANTLVYIAGKGIMLREPSIVAVQRENGQIIAIGNEAKRMAGRVPEAIQIIRPLKDGVIANFEVTQKLIEYLIQKVGARKGLLGRLRPRLVIGIPSGITEVEMRAVIEAGYQAGAKY